MPSSTTVHFNGRHSVATQYRLPTRSSCRRAFRMGAPSPKADALPVTETVRKDVRKGVSHLRYTFHSLSDGGTHFPEQMKKTSQTLGSYHRRYHPQSSGTAERTNGKTGLKQNKFLSRTE